jgi:DNA topoisomerase-1
MRLMVVESPTKARAIQKYLGPEWRVMPSVGHILDLPKDELGVELSTFKPLYIVIDGKEGDVSRLRSAAREAGDDNVYLATDPDREGEAIAAHLEAQLRLRDPKRVTFQDPKREEILKAIQTPRKIDRNLVASQEARRVLDRLEGYGVTGDLRAKTGQPWTAGRTQSPGLRLVVEREEEIRKFVSTTHFGVRLTFDVDGASWFADWVFKSLLPEGANTYWLDRPFAERVAKLRALRVVKLAEKEVRTAPPPAFTTSTLQQAGSASLGFNTMKTMSLAQKLHEKCYISYHATDNPNLSLENAELVRAQARKLGLPVAAEPRMVKISADAQAGHNAICPTHIDIRDGRRSNGDLEALTEDEQKLYELIWRRAVASQLADAIDDARMLQLESIDPIDGKTMLFKAEGKKEKFKGFRQLAADDATKDPTETAESTNPVPRLDEGTAVHADAAKVLDKVTKPPVRYTTATLVKALESRGIGRPRTFATIVETIMRRAYVVEKKVGRTNYLFPTSEGEANMGLVRDRFAVADLGYTKLLEERFDDIATGRTTFFEVVQTSYRQYLADQQKFKAVDVSQLGIVTGGTCPQCKTGTLFRKTIKGKPGEKQRSFWGCSRYKPGNTPDGCSGSFRDRDGAPDFTERTPLVEGDTCPQCSKARLARRVSADGRAWWGCQGYKAGCKATYPDVDGVPDLNRKPPTAGGSCGSCKTGTLYLRTRKDGGKFWSCSGYSKSGKEHCEAIYDDADGKPDTQNRISCPRCKWGALRKINGPKGWFWGCSDRSCRTTMEDVNGKPDPASEAWEKGRSRSSSSRKSSSSEDGAKKRRPRATSGA